jgi:hypothetical protein
MLTLMKKLFYVIVLALATSVCVSSCTEEEVAPKKDGTAGGGAPSEEVRG